MSKISSPISYVFVLLAATLLLLSGMRVDLHIDSAHASDCLAQPKGSEPKGHHWYYRSRQGRKCWHLRETSEVEHHGVPRRSSHAASTASNREPIGHRAQSSQSPSSPEPVTPVPALQAQPPASAAPGTKQIALQSPPPASSAASAVHEPEMNMLRGGAFMMGSNDDPTENPIHQVTLKPFAISRYPISVREWNECAAAKACGFVANGKDGAPVTNVSWRDAEQFVTWLAGATGQPYWLPSEAEWEYAARGGTQTKYWWGDKFVPGLADCKGCTDVAAAEQPVKARSFTPNPFGLYDMGGGVDQWVEDCWHGNYHGASSDGSPWIERDCASHVIRSGSWQNDSGYVRPSSRDSYDTNVRYPTHGFRVALAAAPATRTGPVTAAEVNRAARATAPAAGAEVEAPAATTAALAAPKPTTAPAATTPPLSASGAAASAPPVEAMASATTTASTARSHNEMPLPGPVAAPAVGAPAQNRGQHSAPVDDLKSTDGSGVVSAEDVASVHRKAGANAESGESNAQRYESDDVKTDLFLLAIGLCMMAILILVKARLQCLDCPVARATAARAASRRGRWLTRGAWLARTWKRNATA